MSERRGLGASLRLLGTAIVLVFRSSPRAFVAAMVVQVLAGLGVGLQLLVGQRVLDVLLAADAAGGGLGGLLPEISFLVLVTVGLGVVTSADQGLMRLWAEYTVKYVNEQLLAVAAAVDLESFERPAFFDRLQRAQSQGVSAPIDIASGLSGMASGAIGVLGITAALLALEPLLVPLVLLGYAPIWIASTRNSQALYTFAFGLTPNDRARNYLQSVLTGRDAAKEVRAFSLFSFLKERWEQLFEVRLDEVRALVRDQLRRSAVASLVTSLLLAATLGLLAYLLLSGRMDVAAAATAAVGIQQLGARLQAISQNANTLYESGLFLEDYNAFLALRPARDQTAGAPSPKRFSRLVAEEVSYSYPDADRPALDRVTLEVGQGEIVALVGENGSGKTTLAKVLCGLYRPTAGRVLWDSEDTAALDQEGLRRAVAPIFQDFIRYHLSAWENIGVGDPGCASDREAITAAARAAGAHAFLAALPRGYDTVLSPQFEGGVDLSVGQWQRVAMARAFFRDAPFLVLDEPTAALDPRSEHELFENMRTLAADRAVLLISHRFSTVRSADRIYVLHEGKVVEHGSHAALMASGGRYAELFTLQASAYLEPAPDDDDARGDQGERRPGA